MLSEIIAHKKKQYKTANLENIRNCYDQLKGELSAPRSLKRAFTENGKISLISEIKRRSPSRGILIKDIDIQTVSRYYQDAGAAAVSVLTDEKYFDGSDYDLISARYAISLPVLRKDFIIGEYQVYESRLIGADAILLIVAALDIPALQKLHDLALSIGLEVLMEVHDQSELTTAIATGCKIIGINNRNLKTFTVDLQTSIDLVAQIPDDRVRVSESGIFTNKHMHRLQDAGFNAVLVGESIITAESPSRKIMELLA